jgi:periplasmic divalent cation tolerance protein
MRFIIVTVPKDKAEALGRTVVEERLAACVNIAPSVRSIYRWKDVVETQEEALMFFKTTKAAQKSLTERIRELHPYEVPEIISFEIQKTEGNAEYLDWIHSSVKSF